MSIRYLDYTGVTTLVGLIQSEAESTYATQTELSSTKTELEEEIASAVTGAYTVKGSVAFASLPTSATVGDVYNITDAFTTTTSFVEGSGVEYPAGTNVVYTEDGWDVLTGIFDLSSYVTSDTTVGSGTKPVYVSNGAITASSSTVGGTAKPVWMNSGTVTALSSTVGSSTKPVWMNAGTVTAASSTVGSTTKPVWMNSGTITAFASNVGSTTKPVYMNAGAVTAMSGTAGNATCPVWLNAGTITSTGYDLSTFATESYVADAVANTTSTSDFVAITDDEITALFA